MIGAIRIRVGVREPEKPVVRQGNCRESPESSLERNVAPEANRQELGWLRIWYECNQPTDCADVLSRDDPNV